MYNHTILEIYMPMQKGNIGVKIEYHREKKEKISRQCEKYREHNIYVICVTNSGRPCNFSPSN